MTAYRYRLRAASVAQTPPTIRALVSSATLTRYQRTRPLCPRIPRHKRKPHRIWMILVVLEHCPRMSPPNSYQSLLLCTVVSESSFPFRFDPYCLLAKRSCATGTESQDFQDETFLLPPFSYETPNQLDWDFDSYRH